MNDLATACDALAAMLFCPSTPDHCGGCESWQIGDAGAALDYADALVIVEALERALPAHPRFNGARYNLELVGDMLVAAIETPLEASCPT